MVKTGIKSDWVLFNSAWNTVYRISQGRLRLTKYRLSWQVFGKKEVISSIQPLLMGRQRSCLEMQVSGNSPLFPNLCRLPGGERLWKNNRSEEHTSELQSRGQLVC